MLNNFSLVIWFLRYFLDLNHHLWSVTAKWHHRSIILRKLLQFQQLKYDLWSLWISDFFVRIFRILLILSFRKLNEKHQQLFINNIKSLVFVIFIYEKLNLLNKVFMINFNLFFLNFLNLKWVFSFKNTHRKSFFLL